jgi:membrane protein DedA with SNARE-associated domain
MRLPGTLLASLFALILCAWSPLPQAPATAPAATTSENSAPAPAMPKWIEEGIDRYGAVAIFAAFVVSGVGLHLSEDLILIPAGWLAANDWRTFGEFALAAYLGIVLGDAGWFWMCRTFGTRVMHTKFFKRLFHPRRLLEIKWQIDQRGAWVLLAARFIPGTRTPVITMCGVLHMAWWKLLLVEGTCVLVTAPLQMMIGWLAFHAAAKAGVITAAASDSAHQANTPTINARARRRWWNSEGVGDMLMRRSAAILPR